MGFEHSEHSNSLYINLSSLSTLTAHSLNMHPYTTILAAAALLSGAAAAPAPEADILAGLTMPAGISAEAVASVNVTGPSTPTLTPLFPTHITNHPIDLTKRTDCRVNAAYYGDWWTENGLKRMRLDFSSENTPQQWFCDNWCPLWTNVQCGYDPAERGGTWRLDASMAFGAYADQFEVCMGNVLAGWIAETGCATG